MVPNPGCQMFKSGFWDGKSKPVCGRFFAKWRLGYMKLEFRWFSFQLSFSVKRV